MDRPKSLDELYQRALEYFGRPYIWGGDFEGSSGGDCSGLIQRVLSLVGLDPKGDQTSHDLWKHFRENVPPDYINYRGMGALAFFGTREHISHVGWMVDKHVMLSAAGGGSHCTTVHIAHSLHASVKIQPITFYVAPPLVETIFPVYPF